MLSVTKVFNLVYGHRLWNQQVPPCQCRHLHGHSGRIAISVGCSGALVNGMVLDFNHLKRFKTCLELLDHKMILDRHDPLVPLLLKQAPYTSKLVGPFELLETEQDGAFAEVIDGLVLMDNEPTSENLSICLMTWLNGWLPSELFCVAVRWEETESSSAEVSI